MLDQRQAASRLSYASRTNHQYRNKMMIMMWLNPREISIED